MLRIELLRVLEAWRLLMALGCIVVSIAISYALLGSFQVQSGGSLAGSSAPDVFYVGLNDSLVACILLHLRFAETPFQRRIGVVSRISSFQG